MSEFPSKQDDISIVLCGAAGQGIQTVEQMLTRMFKMIGYNLFSTKEYMSRVRGGNNSTELRVSSHPVNAYVDRIDFLFPMTKEALIHVEKRITSDTIIIGEKDIILDNSNRSDYKVIDIPFSKYAADIGGGIYSNIIMVGVIASLFGIKKPLIEEYLKKRFSSKGPEIIDRNIQAVAKGYEIGNDLTDSGTVTVSIKTNEGHQDDIIINGGEAVALGAIAGGCNYISSYPMTPSTSVLTFLSQHSTEFGIIAEQAEDEIAAINMSIGAWYAGARGMVSTSGGGYALMGEGISLAGIMESPIVVHLAQRPGPATGMPTRTEQSDLEFALYSGHGEFPRVILAPGKVEDAFHLSREAFNCADKYQVPVFILTDQYFIDSYYNIPRIEVSDFSNEYHVVKTGKNYKRYSLTEDGISPRGVPGYGDGLVVVDSDEHDELGHLSEDHDIRVKMNDKRLNKLDLLEKAAIPPELIGNKKCATLVVCWGSTRNIVCEAVERLSRDDVSVLHFSQVYPLSPDTRSYFEQAENLVLVENNATAQFGRILKIHADIDIEMKILKYNGLSFSVEEITDKLSNL